MMQKRLIYFDTWQTGESVFATTHYYVGLHIKANTVSELFKAVPRIIKCAAEDRGFRSVDVGLTPMPWVYWLSFAMTDEEAKHVRLWVDEIETRIVPDREELARA